ncbi:RNA polymerase II-associated protein 3-like isoform X1 [Manduca sexta]|uniref:RNA polymerase II-associated protein 3-like isoform X1 n=2 Tax=Manduca sexta TaxID=7130 RepID=UPI001890B540|nr:RNA polymerase II-associated protein 3-like isoform X1 [Manduca sexta]
MDKALGIQKQIRDNAKTVNNYLTDLQNWEVEMKRKEAALNGQFEQDLPPVRSRAKKEKPVQVTKKKQEERIHSSDYQAWEKFDVEKACEEVDMADVGPTSLDSKRSESAKLEKLREEAQYEKERGNTFVKLAKWDEAIACYNRAIELVKDDAIYYANRGLCYLKKDSLHLAESDCTEALRLDPTYVKALQRRAAARERLGSLRAAATDLTRVLELEPKNNQARTQLSALKTRMGTKGSKSKSSPPSPLSPSSPSTPVKETKPVVTNIVEEKPAIKVESAEDKWRDGIGENITVIKPVKKPPHLRSKRPLKPITIKEIQLGKTMIEKPPTRLKIEEIPDTNGSTDSNKTEPERLTNERGDFSPESTKLVQDAVTKEKDVKSLAPPVNSVQFMTQWKELQGNADAQSDYLSIIDPCKIPSIFANALESSVLSQLVSVLHAHAHKFSRVTAYLQALCNVKRFSALAMFLSVEDKQHLTKILEHCKAVENCSDEVIEDLKNKYEL